MKIVILFIFLLSTVLNASYIRSIRLGSFPNEADAQKSLIHIKSFVSNHSKITTLGKKNIFKFIVRKSGRYYVTVAEPFVDRDTMQTVLDTLRIRYKGAYVTKLSKLPANTIQKKTPLAVEKKKAKEPQLPLKTDKIIIKKKIEEITPQSITLVESNASTQDTKIDTIIKTPAIQTEQKKVKLSKKESIIEQKVEISPALPPKEEVPTLLYGIIFLLSLISIILLFLSLRLRQKNAKLTTHEMINSEKNMQLQNQIDAKTKLISYVSHELRTPMTAIMGLIHLISEEELSAKQKDYISKVQNASEHLLNLINDILDFSKINSGELKIEHNEFNINNILSYVVSVTGVKAKTNNVTLNIDMGKDVPSKIVGDSLRIGQILINLIGNATKFTHDGDITIKVEKKDAQADYVSLEFSVSDTGIGMDEQQVQKIFDSFYQAEDSTSRKFGGTGLGLSISKELVEAMGGEINVVSKKGVGTTFSFTINFKLRDAENKRQYRLPSSKLLDKNVLIINPSNKHTISLINLFGYFNYNVNSLPSLEGAVIDKNKNYDILVIDQYSLTELALKTIMQIKEIYDTKIVVTNEIHSGHINRIQNDVKIDYYLEMPCTQQTILNMTVDLYTAKNSKKPVKQTLKDKLKKLGNKKILVAEDNEINQKVLSGLFANIGFELIFAADGQEAVNIAKNGIGFDLILMDINMPNLNGYEATQEIRKINQYSNIPILALTGDVTQASIDKTIEAGMQGHIVKPIEVDTLYKIILENLQNKKQISKQSAKVKNEIMNSEFNELSIQSGLQQYASDTEVYKSALLEFKELYIHSGTALRELCINENFSEARKLSHEIKEICLLIGAYNLHENLSAMEYTFEKTSQEKCKDNLLTYEASLKALFTEIEKYLSNS